MELNPHIQIGIDAFHDLGENFHEVMLWHLSHGVVMASPEFLCFGYYCRSDDLGTPCPKGAADTGFVTFMSGDMSALKAVAPEGIKFIAFKRAWKNRRPDQIYDIEKFKKLIH